MLTAESVTAGALILCDRRHQPELFSVLVLAVMLVASMYETDGIFMGKEDQNPDSIVAQWDELSDTQIISHWSPVASKLRKFLMKAMAALKA